MYPVGNIINQANRSAHDTGSILNSVTFIFNKKRDTKYKIEIQHI